MFSEKILPLDTPVWSDAVADWVPASAIHAFMSARTHPAASIFAAARDTTVSGSAPHPWIRFFARSIDMCLAFAAVCGAALKLHVSPYVTGGVMVAGWVFLEAAMIAIFGTTPGKLLLGVYVRRHDGKHLTYQQALRRSVEVWLVGMGLGLPVISLIAEVMAHLDLNHNGASTWDRRRCLIVHHDHCAPARAAAAVVGSLALAIMPALSLTWQNPSQRAALTKAAEFASKAPAAISAFTSPHEAAADVSAPTTRTPKLLIRPDDADAGARQAVAGIWITQSPAFGKQKLRLRTVMTLAPDGSFKELVRAYDGQGKEHPDLGWRFAGTWSLVRNRLVKNVASSSAPGYPAGNWSYDLLPAGDGTITLRRVSTPPGYRYAGHRESQTFHRMLDMSTGPGQDGVIDSSNR